jgi:hypothetical protein
MALFGVMLATGAVRTSADVPGALAPPAGNVETNRWYGIGFQIYTATRRTDDTTKFQWTLKAPAATLYNGGGHVVGMHYAGPTWESDNGSKVVGAKIAAVNSPDATAIPWLLLKAVSHAGHGMFSDVTYVQRLYTQGGKAPVDPPTEEGVEVSVPYTATYVFFEPAAE